MLKLNLFYFFNLDVAYVVEEGVRCDRAAATLRRLQPPFGTRRPQSVRSARRIAHYPIPYRAIRINITVNIRIL